MKSCFQDKRNIEEAKQLSAVLMTRDASSCLARLKECSESKWRSTPWMSGDVGWKLMQVASRYGSMHQNASPVWCVWKTSGYSFPSALLPKTSHTCLEKNSTLSFWQSLLCPCHATTIMMVLPGIRTLVLPLSWESQMLTSWVLIFVVLYTIEL